MHAVYESHKMCMRVYVVIKGIISFFVYVLVLAMCLSLNGIGGLSKMAAQMKQDGQFVT